MRARILIADDSQAIREVVARFLEVEGYEPLVATGGHEALRRIRTDAPDLVLLDVEMPDMDGYAVCREIKRDEATALIPVTMLTVLADSEHRRRGIEAGADDFLPKPFDEHLLRARIESQLRTKRLTDQLERTESVIFSLARAVEAKDMYTEGHIWRMSEYSRQLAAAAGLAPDGVRAVYYGGFLHDIGKIALDDAILRKAEPLTAREYALVKQHPETGARIVEPMRFARDVAPIILGHHEHWDGRGYPLGLRGEQIHIGARIVAIVDAYDAMMTDRPYRRALSRASTIARLRARAGTQWDPALTEIFVGMLDRDELHLPEREPRAELERAVGA